MSYAFSQLPAGILVDRIGPRILLGVGLVIWSVAQGAAGSVTSYAQFFAARIGLGVGNCRSFQLVRELSAIGFTSRSVVFPPVYSTPRRAIGTALAPPILTWLMLAYGWRIMFIVMGVVGLVVAAAWFLLYRDADRHGTEEDRAYIRAGDTARTSSPVGIKWGRFCSDAEPHGA